jgi:hypothetical protein
MKHLKYFKESIINEHDIDDIVDSYLECALWTSEEQGDDFEDKTIHDFSVESRELVTSEMKWFVAVAGDALDDISDDMIGHDIWLTRNGHVAGFWDRGYDEDVEKILVELSQELGFTDIYVGDDGLVYLSGKDRYKDFDLEKYKMDKTAKKYNL